MVARRIQLAACTWALVAATAHAQGAKLLFFPVYAPPGTKVVPPAKYVDGKQVGFRPDGGQYLIPKFANGGFPPAQTVCGIGQRGVIQGTLTTGNQPIVACEQPSYMPVLRNLAILGPDTWNDNYHNGGDVWGSPSAHNRGAGDIGNRTGTITQVTGSGVPVDITSAGHGLETGFRVTVTGVTGNTNANVTNHTITKIDGNVFRLDGVTGNGSYGGGGSWSSPGVTPTSPIRVHTLYGNPDYGHTLETGATVTISGISGISGASDGTYTITRINQHWFSLNGTTGSGTYTDGTGGWTSTYWDRWKGATIESIYGLVDDCVFYYLAGTGLEMLGGAAESPSTPGYSAPWFASPKLKVRQLTFNRCYRGLDFNHTDGIIEGRLDMLGLRDYGIKCSGSAVQFVGEFHGYGIWSGAPRTAPGKNIWITGQACFGSGPFYLETGEIGMFVSAKGQNFSNIYTHSCPQGNIVLQHGSGSFTNVVCALTNSGTNPVDGHIRLLPNSIRSIWNTGTMDMATGTIGFKMDDARGHKILNWTFYARNNCTCIQTRTGENAASRLEECDVRIHVVCENDGANGVIGIQLNPSGFSRLGKRNRILITTGQHRGVTDALDSPANGGAYDPKYPIIVPDTFLPNNYIELNGIRIEPPPELTIASGVITVTSGYHRVDTQSDAASDDVDTINGGQNDQWLILRSENSSRTVVVKHGTGNIQLTGGSDYSLNSTSKRLYLIYDGTNWVERSRI